MLPLGHMGIGRRLVSRWASGLPTWVIYAGALLPDVVDKPLYHLGGLITGRTPVFGIIAGTRSIGHMLLVTMVFGLVAWRKQWPVGQALALGMVSHLVLDTAGDLLSLATTWDLPHPRGGLGATLWPALGWHFPAASAPTLKAYTAASFSWVNIACEVLGAVLLLQDWQVSRKRGAVAP